MTMMFGFDSHLPLLTKQDKKHRRKREDIKKVICNVCKEKIQNPYLTFDCNDKEIANICIKCSRRIAAMLQ